MNIKQKISYVTKSKKASTILLFCVLFIVVSMTVIANTNDVYQTDENTVDGNVVATGTSGFSDCSAPWRLYDNGTMVVDSGSVEVSPGAFTSPWWRPNASVVKIIFTGPITSVHNRHGTPSLSDLFAGLYHLTTIEGLEYIDTSTVTSVSGAFSDARSLSSLDLLFWDTSSVLRMSGTFAGASGLTNLAISNWDTSSVLSMSSTFAGASGLTNLAISNWDTSNVTSMIDIFSGAMQLTNLDVSEWNTSSVTSMDGAFRNTRSLTDLDVSAWDTSQVRTMLEMFWGAGVVSLDLSNWDTSNVTCMFSMFRSANELTSLDISGWDTRNVRCMNRIFYAPSLSQFTLGPNFVFNTESRYCGPSFPRTISIHPGHSIATVSLLSPVPENETYTGHWQNVGTGTVDAPEGIHVLTSEQLVETYDGATMADTWVWQRHEWLIQPTPSPIPSPTPAPTPTPTPTPPSFIPGDVNGDGQVTAADVAILRAYLAGFPVDICRYAADVNSDGQITAADLALLRAYLAGFPVTLGQ